jgi:hypothetical protein
MPDFCEIRNLFEQHDMLYSDTRVHWFMSPYVWVFFTISIPLTLLTLGYWRWNLGRAIRSRTAQGALRWVV